MKSRFTREALRTLGRLKVRRSRKKLEENGWEKAHLEPVRSCQLAPKSRDSKECADALPVPDVAFLDRLLELGGIAACFRRFDELAPRLVLLRAQLDDGGLGLRREVVDRTRRRAVRRGSRHVQLERGGGKGQRKEVEKEKGRRTE